jgi:hypothetical protein
MPDAYFEKIHQENWLREARETIEREKVDQKRHRAEASRHLRLAYMCDVRARQISDEIDKRTAKDAAPATQA